MTTPSIACDAHDSSPQSGADKVVLRRALLTARKAISDSARLDCDTRIGERVLGWASNLASANPGLVLGVYWPIRDEPDLRPAYARLSAQGIRLALPVVAGKDLPLGFLSWTPGDPMIKDSFGVAIPASGEPVSPQALLVPCVGFNRQRLRLGYGGGFYDRTLAVHPRPITAGIGYACALVDFKGAAHDITLDMIFTETGVL